MRRRIGHRRALNVPMCLIAAAVLNWPTVYAQSGESPAFEVASVKPHKQEDKRRPSWEFLPGGRFTATNVPLRIVIATAYNVGFQSARLTGGPSWANSMESVYDIEATPGKGII